MDMLVVHGGRPLMGRIAAGGAKNAALPIMAAALAMDGPSTIHNVPDLVDVRTLAALLTALGANVAHTTDGRLSIDVVDDRDCVAEYDLVRKMRAGVCVLGPLLARRGRACVSLPGGCNIGHRPIDLHLKGLRALGADVRIERGYVIATAERLRGARIYLGGPFGSTVTGTCNVMTAAALAEGTTVIEAAACEPEVVDLGDFLIAAGAQIHGLGTPTIEIEGVPQLHGCSHTVIPDRVEAATLMIAAAATRGCVTVAQTEPRHLTAVIEKLREAGVAVTIADDEITVDGKQPLQAVDCIALPYPAIPTDLQAQLTALMTQGDGMSVVTDKVFPDRFMHVSELARMGARIRREGASAIISGPTALSGASVMASDLRASAALVIAALAADGPSAVRRIYHLDRGYESLEVKLATLGAQISRTSDSPGALPSELKPSRVQPPSGPHWRVVPSPTTPRSRAG